MSAPETNRSASMVATGSIVRACHRSPKGEDDSVTPVDFRPTTGQEGIADPPHYGSDLGVSDGMLLRGCHGDHLREGASGQPKAMTQVWTVLHCGGAPVMGRRDD